MNLTISRLKEVWLAIAFVVAMVATFYFNRNDSVLFLIAFFSSVVIASFNRQYRNLFPVLLIVIGIRFFEVLFSLSLMKISAFGYLLTTGLCDLVFAFLLVHYSQDESLKRLCKVRFNTGYFPQIHWIAIILGFCCFYRLAAAVEFMLHKYDNQFFQGDIPFFFSTGPTAMLIMRLAIDTLLWSMLLFPRKLAHLRVTPPSQATPD